MTKILTILTMSKTLTIREIGKQLFFYNTSESQNEKFKNMA